MLLWEAVIFIVPLVAILVWIVSVKRKNKKFYDGILGPPPLPLLGNTLEVSTTKDILNALTKFMKMYGGVYKIHLGPIQKVLVVSDYKFLECVLSSTRILNKSDEYDNLKPWLGTGLLTSDGPKWKKRRRILTPAFHFQILEQFIEIFEAGGERLISKLKKTVDSKSVDIYPFITLATLDIICETAMGTKINAQINEQSLYVRSVKRLCRVTVERLFSILQLSDITFPLTPNYYIQNKCIKVLHNHTNEVINKRREYLQNKIKQASSVTKETYTIFEEDEDVICRKKKVFLDLLLEATVDGQPLTQEEIREEVDTFMFEGHDTTASAISFALYSLATNPEVQKVAYDEQVSLFGDNKSPEVTYANLQSMKYLEQVIKETLRLYPSVPFYARKTNETIVHDGLVIPEGVTLCVFAYGAHRNPDHFKDPEKFDPERFNFIDGKYPYSYIPFSAGPRNCIGQKFAMLEMKSTISKILRNFELKPSTPEHKLELCAETVLKSANGVKISLNLRS